LSITKDVDSQPLSQAFSFSKQKSRAVHGLKGILIGIVADQKLNEKELLFLDTWLKSQQYLADDQDVVGILSMVGDSLANGFIPPQSLQIMQDRIEALIVRMKDFEGDKVAGIQELLGFLSGIAADGQLNDQEVGALSSWLDNNHLVRDKWPASVVVNRVTAILEDGIITHDERQDLMRIIQQVAGKPLDSQTLSPEASVEVWEDSLDSINLAGSTFCLTGDFVSGDRNYVDKKLRDLGADTSPGVNSSVDFLVIGTLASQNWLYTSHGRKIEKALHLKRKGIGIKTITERSLLKFVKLS
jgi:NAD-dependent DNA ligase